ncbi:MAG: hypothetical protein WDN75_11485 [Bacteroidota bacterium]
MNKIKTNAHSFPQISQIQYMQILLIPNQRKSAMPVGRHGEKCFLLLQLLSDFSDRHYLNICSSFDKNAGLPTSLKGTKSFRGE